MDVPDIFFNRAGRVRSIWRLAAFTVGFMAAMMALWLFVLLSLPLLLSEAHYNRVIEGNWGFILQAVIIFVPALLAGWACGHALEDLPPRALGITLHKGWARDLLVGSLVGAAGIVVALGFGVALGGYGVAPNAGASFRAVVYTLASSAFIFVAGAAAEEMLFRGYALQTMMRSWPIWLALVPTSIPFALVHLDNPNVVPGFTFANTVLAGVWLAIAYWRTRSLWFPFGLHWSWNWTMGALVGSPVSGLTAPTPDPLLRLSDQGPAWIGGGAYGIEGGAACTLALVALTVFTLRTRLVSATPELRQFTDEENPNPSQMPLVPRGRDSQGGEDKIGEGIKG